MSQGGSTDPVLLCVNSTAQWRGASTVLPVLQCSGPGACRMVQWHVLSAALQMTRDSLHSLRCRQRITCALACLRGVLGLVVPGLGGQAAMEGAGVRLVGGQQRCRSEEGAGWRRCRDKALGSLGNLGAVARPALPQPGGNRGCGNAAVGCGKGFAGKRGCRYPVAGCGKRVAATAVESPTSCMRWMAFHGSNNLLLVERASLPVL